MCDRAGIDALWVGDHFAETDGHPRLEAWTALTLAGLDTSRARLGAMLDVAFRPPTILAAMAGTLDVALGGRLEIGLSGGRLDPERRPVEEYATTVRRLLARDPATRLGGASPQPGGPPLSVEATDALQIAVAARVADDVVIPLMAVKDTHAAIEQVREECRAAGRDPSSLGIALEVPVSIGRTSAEAQARVDAESLFRTIGHPSKGGIFGTLEQGQDRVIELAHAGVTDLRCVLPNTADVHDVIAQLTAMVVGTAAVLAPNSPRSKAPDPPEKWGGRPPGR